MRSAIEKDLERLENLGVIEKIAYSDWAAPIVPVPKPDGTIRICGDYKVTINPLLKVDQYPVPKAEDLFSTLAGGNNPQLPIKLDCDASAYGIGAVISHVFPDKTECPIAYTSRTLTAPERNYPQIEKEALALVNGVKKFHQFLFGRHFILVTDHKPLTTILGPKKGLPTLAAARLQRWAMFLSNYRYDLEFRKTERHCNADGFSRLPLRVMRRMLLMFSTIAK